MRIPFLLIALIMSSMACSLIAGPTPVPTRAASATSVIVGPTTKPTAMPTAVPSTETAAPTTLPPVSQLPSADSAVWVLRTQGLTQPLDIQNAGDDRLFIVEQPGVIRVVRDGILLPDPFLDIRSLVVNQGNEQGLLGLAFDPAYTDNGFFYINYTGAGGKTRVVRYQVSGDPNRADPDSASVLLGYDQPYQNHNGGGLAFGPDGYLYIGAGDGGSGGDPLGNGQSLGTPLGKILRIDVHAGELYATPADNPFIGQDGARPEIWDYGLRNPWRFTFDRATGDLYIADVGQNQWEEINFEAAGSGGGVNYGWNRWEGMHAYQGDGEGTTLPVAEYSHSQGCSVTGGVVLRDPALPAWNGVYLYADYCSGAIWGLVRDLNGEWLNDRLYTLDANITAFGTDANGSVFLADRGGTIYQLQPN
ncbi:MAG: PQQ-dependent sugar dehydrogenase [Anaerolineales bacterium]